jgi:hypothetical protein
LAALSVSYLVAPEGWSRSDATGIGPFVTREHFDAPDGTTVEWASRQHRKQRGRLDAGRGSTWWAPTAVGWWIGVLFAVGSLLFTVGAFPGYVGAVGTDADAITFFVGSIFFTVAAYLQFLQTVNAPHSLRPGRDEPLRFWTWEPSRIDWSANLVQLVGTVCFNVTTLAAIDDSLNATQAHRLVWVPDMAGSVCFLVASGLAWFEVSHGWWSWRPIDTSWRIAALNLAGSIAFGVSAVASKIVPTTGEPRNIMLVNLGTALGGLCFLAGALFLFPERTAAPAADPHPPEVLHVAPPEDQ